VSQPESPWRFAATLSALLCLLWHPQAASADAWQTPWHLGPEARDVVRLGTPSVTQDIAQTRDGYLWFASMNGLFQYDGDRLSRIDLGVGGPSARQLLAARDGGLWVATGGGYLDVSTTPNVPMSLGMREGMGGLCLVHHGKVTQVLPSDGRPEHWVWSLAELADGTLAVGTEDGVWLISNREEPPQRLPWPALDVNAHQISSLLTQTEHDHEVLLISNALGVWKWNPLKREPPQLQFAMAGVRSLSAAESGFWIVNDDKLVLVEHDRISLTVQGEPGEQMRSLLAVPGSPVWVGTTLGLRQLRGNKLVVAQEVLPKQSVRSLMMDREGSIWASVKGIGVAQLRVPVVKNLGRAEGLPSDVVLSAIHDADPKTQALWLMTPSGLIRVHDGALTLLDKLANDEDWRLRNMASQADGSLWLGFDRLAKYTKETVAFFSAKVSGGDVRALFVDDDDDLWLGYLDGGAAVFAKGDLASPPVRLSVANGLCSDSILAIAKGIDRTLWFVSSGGVAHMKKGDLQASCVSFDKTANVKTTALTAATGVVQETNGTAWVTATGSGGLFRLKDGKLSPVPSSSGFPPASLYAALLDGLGNAWFSSNQGLFLANLSELDRWTDGGGEAPKVFHVDHESGMRSSDCQATFSPLMLPWGQGGVMVATALGLAAVKPPNALVKPQVLPFIETVLVDGKQLDSDRTIGPGSKRIDIFYNAPTFAAARRPRFEQRLDGMDSQWRQVGEQRSAQLTALAPGRYTFRVRVERGYTSTVNIASISFEVLAPWYRRWSTIVAAFCVLAFCLFLLDRMRVARLAAKFQTIADERNRIARDWHDGLSQVFVGIGYQLEALRLRLGSKSEPAVVSLIDETKVMVKDAQEGVKAVLWDLRASNDSNSFLGEFRALADLAQRRFGVTVQVRSSGTLPQAGPLTEEWPKIAKEALTNAVKHGQAKQIGIAMNFTEALATMTIDDDGHGTPLQGSGSPAAKSFGLVGMKERAARCGGTVSLETRPEGGSRLRVVVDLSKNV
jgi:signal transduction histidine kinase/ligand-binding sensor domain-containing protein